MPGPNENLGVDYHNATSRFAWWQSEFGLREEIRFFRPLLNRAGREPFQWQHFAAANVFADGGTSLAGFSAKNPCGFNRKPM